MAKYPTLDLEVPDYLADTLHLTYREHGIYLMVLMQLWMAPGQRFPNDDAWLARKFRMTPEEVETELRPLIAEFCQTDGNWITQRRIAREFQKAEERSRKQSGRAKARWKKEKELSHGNASTGSAPRARSTDTDTVTPHTPQGGAKANGHSPVRKQEIDAAFDRFWATYPRHETKAKAREKLELILKRHEATADELIQAAASYARRMAAEGRPHDKLAHPTTWLNQKRWLDEAEHPGQPRASPGADLTPEERERYRQMALERQKERQH